MFTGVFTALITPFKDNSIDYSSLEKLVEYQIESGVDGIVALGTTGESPTVSFEEHEEVIHRVVAFVNKRIKVIAGTGANSTAEAVHLSKAAQDAGVDAVLQVNPYYNKPTQKGLITHFSEVAKSIDIPIILYNIPGRTGVNFFPESVMKLCEVAPNVVAMKEASGDIAQMMHLHELAGDRLTILSGDDNLLLPLLSIGGQGVISVLSNLLPGDVKRVVTLFEEGNLKESRELFYKLLPLSRAMFMETNPIPIKAAMEMSGLCSSEMRLPMQPLPEEKRTILKAYLEKFGVTLK